MNKLRLAIEIVILFLTFSFIFLKNKETKALEQELTNKQIELAAKSLDLNHASDSINTLKSEIYTIKDTEGNLPDVKYVTKYKTDTRIVTELANLRKQTADKDKQLRALEEYCDSFAGNTNIYRDTIINQIVEAENIFPFDVNMTDAPWYDLFMEVHKDSSFLDLKLSNQLSIRHQEFKKGIWPFRKKTYQVIVNNPNPYIVGQSAQTYIIK